MSALSDFVAVVDELMPTPKRLVGADSAPVWRQGRDGGDTRIVLPLEINGEQRGAALVVMAYPNYPSLMFRIGIKFLEYVVCRIDFELDGAHANNFAAWGDMVPPFIKGPHWHSWEVNRNGIRSLGVPLELHNAVPFLETRKFDAALRWYCAERNIQLGKHDIELPPREKLL